MISTLQYVNTFHHIDNEQPDKLAEKNYSHAYSLFLGFFSEFRHNRFMQSPHENYFNLCQEQKEK